MCHTNRKNYSLYLLILVSCAFSILVFIYAIPPEGRPDLAVSDLSGDWGAKPGEQIEFRFTVENKGDGPSGSCYWGVYISSGAYWVGTKLADGTIYAMDPDESDSYSGSAELPQDIEPDYYYLYAVADDGEYEDDSDRSNNVAYINFQVLKPSEE